MEAEKKNASPTLSELLRDYMKDVYKRQAPEGAATGSTEKET